MSDTGCDSIEDLIGALRSGQESQKTLERYTEWFEQEEERKLVEEEQKKRESDSDDEATIERLTNELQDERNKQKQQKLKAKEQKEVERQISNFYKTVKSQVNKSSDIPAELQGFVARTLGVENPFNTVNFTDKNAVLKMVQDGIGEFVKMKNIIIDEYKKTQNKEDDVPVIPNAADSKTTVATNKKPLGVAAAKTLFEQKVREIIGNK